MTRAHWVFTGLVLVGCGAKVLDFESSDAGTNPGAGGGSPGAGGAQAPDTGVPWSSTEPSLCGGKECGTNEICCFLDGACFDPQAHPELCPAPPPDDEGARCASNADCSSSEFCESDVNTPSCLGAGHCVARGNCGTSGGMPWCGCDGVTYPDKQTSCVYGVRIATERSCGEVHEEGGGGAPGAPPPLIVTGCGHSSDCSAGQDCCFIYGKCYDPNHPVLCTFPPEGTRASCETNLDCYPVEYCSAEACEAPGGCTLTPGSCSGVVNNVCGCDGQTYQSSDCAAQARVNVDHPGGC